MLFRVGITVKNILFPPPPDVPTVDFGKLPAIQFGEPAVNQNFKYTVDTLTGTLPTLTDRIRVYKTRYAPLTLLNSDRAKRKAQAINFVDNTGRILDPILVSPIVYQWQKDSQYGKKVLIMNIETYDFTLTSEYLSSSTLPAVNYGEREAAGSILGTLGGMGLRYDDLDETKTKAQLLSVKEGTSTLIPATSVSKAQLISVDVYQKNIDDIAVFYPRYPQSTMRFLLAGGRANADDIIDANFKHVAVDKNQSGVYPIKTAAEAFEELKAGNGFISNYYGSTNTVSVTDVYLGYFIGNEKQEYIMPVIVFQGEGEFYGFISAVKEEWIDR